MLCAKFVPQQRSPENKANIPCNAGNILKRDLHADGIMNCPKRSFVSIMNYDV